jgi:hypothetical protein
LFGVGPYVRKKRTHALDGGTPVSAMAIDWSCTYSPLGLGFVQFKPGWLFLVGTEFSVGIQNAIGVTITDGFCHENSYEFIITRVQ